MYRRILTIPLIFLVIGLLFIFLSPVPAMAQCSIINETFAGAGPGIWSYNNATWTVQNGKLNVKGITSGKIGYAEASIAPNDYFLIDTDVQPVTLSAQTGAYGIYVYTSGSSYFTADGRTVDGLAVFAWEDGSVTLSGWDVNAGAWHNIDNLPSAGSISSVGLKFSSNVFTVRINKQDTSLKVSGALASPSVLDRVWLFGQGSASLLQQGTEVNFDNVCGDPLTAPVYKLTVAKSGTGTGTVTSSPPGISCGADCSEDYNQGTGVKLTATPSAGSTFSGWSGGGCAGTGTCTVTMNAAKTVTASFTKAVTTLQAPQNFKYVLLDNMLSLSWNAVSGASGYKVGIGIVPGSYLGDFDAGNSLQVGPLDVTGASGTFYLAVKAYNSAQESVYSSELVITINSQGGLQAPKNLRYTLNGNMLTIEWDGVSGATGYEAGLGIQAGSYSGPYDIGNIIKVGPADISGAAPGIYYIAVRAYDNSGASGYSNEVALKLGSPVNEPLDVSSLTSSLFGALGQFYNPSTTPVILDAIRNTFFGGGLDAVDNLIVATYPVFTKIPNGITADFGNGFTTQFGNIMKGKVSITHSNVNTAGSRTTGNFSIIADKLYKDGEFLVDGSASGDVDLTFDANNYVKADINFNGSVSASGLLGALGANAALAGQAVNASGTYGSVSGSVHIDGAKCPNFPVSGSVAYTINGQTTTVTFNGKCTDTAYVVNNGGPIISSIAPNSGQPGDTVTITGSGFGSTQGASTVKFVGVAASNIMSWSDTSIVVTVPNINSTGDVIVTVGGKDSNGVKFTVLNQCSTQQVSGADTPETRIIDLGKTSGTFAFEYDTYYQQDRITVTYEGQVLFDTGCVGATGSENLTYSGSSTTVTVTVEPNCAGGTGTAWDFTVSCPQ